MRSKYCTKVVLARFVEMQRAMDELAGPGVSTHPPRNRLTQREAGYAKQLRTDIQEKAQG